jgi:hypothetical protein
MPKVRLCDTFLGSLRHAAALLPPLLHCHQPSAAALPGWLVIPAVSQLVGRSVGRLVSRVSWLVGWSFGLSVGWLVGRLVGQSQSVIGCLVGQWVSWFFGLSVGWLVSQLVGQLVSRSVGKLLPLLPPRCHHASCCAAAAADTALPPSWPPPPSSWPLLLRCSWDNYYVHVFFLFCRLYKVKCASDFSVMVVQIFRHLNFT